MNTYGWMGAESKRGTNMHHKLPFPLATIQAREFRNNSPFVCQLAFKAMGMSLLDLSGKLVKL